MAIQINGNGTITGISVGGLPDGIVDTDMLAANAVTDAKSTISGGKIKQIVQATSHTRLDTTSTTYVATSHSITITPTVANSKILVNFTLTVNSNGTNHRAYVDIYRSINGGTFTGIAPVGSNETVGANNNSGFFGQIRADNSRLQAPTHIHYLDSPSYSLGNAIVYKMYARSSNSSNTIEIPSSSNAEPVVMMLTEVAA
jgi:hypothetical protein